MIMGCYFHLYLTQIELCCGLFGQSWSFFCVWFSYCSCAGSDRGLSHWIRYDVIFK
ncbi:hypothetical protein LINGRAHAP2_LOCUS16548 [Linum grandiflorum]